VTSPFLHNKNDGLLLESGATECLREERVWRLTYVQLGTWLFFATYLGARGFTSASMICFIEVAVMFVLANLKSTAFRTSYALVMNTSLVLSGIGVTFVALSDPALHRTIFFFQSSILISSQLLGVRAAFFWFLATLAAHTVFGCIAFTTAGIWAERIDELTISFGASAVLFFCCQQGEAFFRERTEELTSFSKSLSRKSTELHRLATTDSLTGLLNRLQFQTELASATSNAKATGEPMALFVIDMDGFKEVNDTLGHPVGDASLIEVAKRLREAHGESAVLSRLGGDEFCVIIPNVGSSENAGLLASQTGEALGKRYVVDQSDFLMSASIGIALCPHDSKEATDLFAFADTAMFHAKESKLGYASYEPSMTSKLVDHRNMLEKLSLALENDEFFLVYQPQVCISTGKIFGAEALLRWNCEGEIILPDQFIPMLEKNREIIQVGKWIIQETCRQLQRWEQRGLTTRVSINVSPLQFLDEDFNTIIERSIAKYQVDATNLDFEITESLLIEDVAQATEKLTRIKELGASVSLDDFGTGYSSLSYLKQFPMDRLKIDRAFVKDFPAGDDGGIASSIIALGKAVDLKVLAEGVETTEQLDYLKSLDCDEYQGFLFSRPLSAKEFESLASKETADQELTATTER